MVLGFSTQHHSWILVGVLKLLLLLIPDDILVLVPEIDDKDFDDEPDRVAVALSEAELARIEMDVDEKRKETGGDAVAQDDMSTPTDNKNATDGPEPNVGNNEDAEEQGRHLQSSVRRTTNKAATEATMTAY